MSYEYVIQHKDYSPISKRVKWKDCNGPFDTLDEAKGWAEYHNYDNDMKPWRIIRRSVGKWHEVFRSV